MIDDSAHDDVHVHAVPGQAAVLVHWSTDRGDHGLALSSDEARAFARQLVAAAGAAGNV